MTEVLAPNTAAFFDSITRLECIKPYTLMGGTALSLQLGSRRSEDLDFMSWAQRKNQKMEVDWPEISRQLATIGTIDYCDILDLDHVIYVVSGINLSFYACPRYSPVKNPILYQNNLVIADKLAIGAMKMEVMLRHSTFRDYYDIYSLLQDGIDINQMIDLALKYSQHKLKRRNIVSMLTNHERFVKDEKFDLLNPVYDVNAQQIQEYISNKIKENPI